MKTWASLYRLKLLSLYPDTSINMRAVNVCFNPQRYCGPVLWPGLWYIIKLCSLQLLHQLHDLQLGFILCLLGSIITLS